MTEQPQLRSSSVAADVTPITGPIPVGDCAISYDERPLTVRVRIDVEDVGGFSGQCVEYPAAITEGDTVEELLKNMYEAVLLVLENPRPKFLVLIGEFN